MGAEVYLSAEEARKALCACADSRIAVVHAVAHDMTPALAAKAQQFAEHTTHTLVLCVNDMARERMVRACGGEGMHENITVATVAQLCARIFADERVAPYAPRGARVLDANEYDVLLEDMKASGLKTRRLREMLKFFLKSMSEYEHEREGWLVTSEEQMMYAMLQTNLEAREAALPCEVASLAYEALLKSGVERAPLAVVVEDFGALSKASQRLVRFVATQRLVASGALEGAAYAEEPYPHYEGMGELMRDDFATVLQVAPEAGPACACDAYATPRDEFSGVADKVAHLVEGGMAPEDIMIATPHPIWARYCHEALAQRGIAAQRIGGTRKIKGDPRKPDACASLKLAAFLKLCENPRDMTALRSWLGLGDWLLRSDAFLELMAYASEQGISTYDAFAKLRAMPASECPLMLFDKFNAAFEELETLRAALETATAREAAKLLKDHGMALDARCVKLLGGPDEPARMHDLARGAFAAEPCEGGVRIAPYEACCGAHARAVFVCGVVGGFLPRLDALDEGYTVDHRQAAFARDKKLFDAVCAAAREQLVCSHFSEDLLENADALRMRLARVISRNGQRFARVEASAFIQ